jgi:hypothetical protein
MRKRLQSLVRAVSGVLVLGGIGQSAAHAVSLVSNGTGGGAFSAAATWSPVHVPDATNVPVTIAAGDLVTATGDNYSYGNVNFVALGTFNITSSSSITGINRINNTLTTGGTINVNDSSLTAQSINGTVTININSGGIVSMIATSNPNTTTTATININSGGTYQTVATNGSAINLIGGTLVDTNGGSGRSFASWSGGTFVDNGNSWSASSVGGLMTLFNSNSNNRLQLSNSGSAKAFLLTSTNTVSATMSTGIVQFNLYSKNANDNDMLGYVTTDAVKHNYTITNGVTFDIEEGAALTLSDVQDMIANQTAYKLIDDNGATTYSDILANVPSQIWGLGNLYYTVAFDKSQLAVDGTISISSVTLAPEPGMTGIGMMIGCAVGLRRRRSSRFGSRAV